MAVPMVSFAHVVTFEGFRCRVAPFHVAGVAFRDIQTCFVTCGKSFCGKRNTCVAFFVAGATLST